MKEISSRLNKTGNKPRRRELKKKREKPNKQKDWNKKERREKVKRCDFVLALGFKNPKYFNSIKIVK